ncbi:MAG: RNA methyltransferase [Clostridia bacterium]|nr:RNA methyltransferase [Clostridia bacterium]
MIITSKDNEIIKNIRKLKDKKYRDEKNEFIIEGIKIIEEAMEENAVIKKIVVCDECSSDLPQDLLYKIAKFDVIYVPEKIFKIITDVNNPQGILAVVEKNNNKEINYNSDFFLVLDNIQDPGNMGTILRTADSINLKQIIVAKGSSDCYNPKVVRSTMGAIFRVNVIECDLVKTIKELKKHKIKIFATDLNTENSIYDVKYEKTAVVIGNEANGVSDAVLDISDEKIKIPMLGRTESLNAGVATGIIVYEAMRQMNLKK